MSSGNSGSTAGPPIDLSVLIGGLDRRGLLIGSWVAGLFWSILLCQTYLFFQKRSREHNLVRVAVLLVLGFESTKLAILINVAWQQLIDAFDNSLLTQVPNGRLAYAPLMSGLTMLSVNSFLIFRLWRLSKNMWLAIGLSVCNLGSYATLTASHSIFIQVTNGNFAHLREGSIAAKVGLTLSFSIMALITSTLVVFLLRFLRKETKGLRPMILHLVFFTIQSGFATTAMGAASLVYFNRFPTSSNNVTMISITSAFYACNMLAKLNMRGAGSYGLSLNSKGTEVAGDRNLPIAFQLVDPWQYLEEQMLEIREQSAIRVRSRKGPLTAALDNYADDPTQEKDDIAPWDNGPAQ